MTRDDMVAALERAAEVIDSLLYTEEAKIVRALADALREGTNSVQVVQKGGDTPYVNQIVWLIPEPRLP